MKKTISLVLVLALGLASVGLAAEDTWIYRADMPTARTWAGGCVIDGKIYVIGGGTSASSVTSAVEVYDPIVDTWTKLANMPSGRCFHATCTFDGKIYVFGGVSPGVFSTAKNNVYVYDPQIDTWTQKADMPNANAHRGIAVVDGTIYLIGGGPVGLNLAYNPITESWTQKADMPTARTNLSACVVDGKIYAIGGATEDWREFSYKHVEVYDPSTNSWTRKSDMPTERWSLGACVVDGRIYAIGGNSALSAVRTTNEVYDPITDTWTTRSPLQQKRLGHLLASIGDKIYAIGGHYYPNLRMVTKTEEYDTGLGVPSPDFNGDGIVDSADMCIMIDHWGEDYPLCDIAPPPFGDGIVEVQDLIILAEHLFEPFPPVEPVEVNEDDDGGQVELRLGQILVVTLESNPTTGYRWEQAENPESILKQIGAAEFVPSETGDPPLVGAGGWEILRFRASSAGQMTLQLVYHRPWDEGVEPLKTFSLQVAVP